jgi:hypothetical protein
MAIDPIMAGEAAGSAPSIARASDHIAPKITENSPSYAAAPERHQVDLVVAEQLQVLKAGAATDKVVGDVEHVVRFVVRQVVRQHGYPAVDLPDEPRLSGQFVNGPDPARVKRPGPLGRLVVNVARRKHGLGLFFPLDIPQAVLDSPPAIPQDLSSNGAHSECPPFCQEFCLTISL